VARQQGLEPTCHRSGGIDVSAVRLLPVRQQSFSSSAQPVLLACGTVKNMPTQQAALLSAVYMPRRWATTARQRARAESTSNQTWWIAVGCVSVLGFTFSLVPLYKIYCQHVGQGQAILGHKEYTAPPEPGSPEANRLIQVDFAATVHPSLDWQFVPQQRRMTVGLGETALAFYRAKSMSDKPIIGVSVYHMIPPEAGLYFNKIQCFCFNEQLLNPNEEVDLPIFFFIDPMMGKDSRFDHIDRISLSYVFFESDSELPEEYKDYIRATPSNQLPPTQMAPNPGAQVAAAT